ncbi:bifunctional glutamine-synthetase adenylyltransferase/deadenyltransferase [Subtercola boreus]|uniref:Bifunctional glutamine-synthetase adenylyltransferase/deadenyltransferase n=1 Tax=Subtercola boreus TaxID=120213 RepID=A0A3E0VIM2_9MICO|nr:bifunctional [glutamine synthetase] adenylyltransferase/[glutamine synthetase]-adenylyl-L-tyrosine phosphorylase [Subtercola boreus]RFA09475.1 bifunctional glutamine-synthetase adenylyltransferase/deadenyltransferase [Subtercola boreus]TQL53474.1 glutamate-ammonia-ligase adenylyltransferase [Subtercola boreus]
MARISGPLSLTELARVGFSELGEATERLELASELGSVGLEDLLASFRLTADPDQALSFLVRLLRLPATPSVSLLAEEPTRTRLLRVFGASAGFGDFFLRHPEELGCLSSRIDRLPTAAELQDDLLNSVASVDGFATIGGGSAGAAGAGSGALDGDWTLLRVRYRRVLAQITAYDLEQSDPVGGVDGIARTLADLAAAALDASLACARSRASTPGRSRWSFGRDEVAATCLAIIGMGKSGAHELNYVSDVDVIFVGEGDDEAGLETGRAIDIATALAMLTMHGIMEPTMEPSLWEVDPNLRPEGMAGALVRSLASHLAYYERWAKSWEFQALLKARPLAGDMSLGQRYADAVGPMVWTSASRDGFVESVQKMRQRVTDHIPADEVDWQLKLGPGGLRDIEFTVQLLQLVHGQNDPLVRHAGTLPALAALADQGYIGRVEGQEFSHDYRVLRLMEHRLQLRNLRRTHLVPRDEFAQRVLARATELAPSAPALLEVWNAIKLRVRTLHERLFYRPLLAAVAALSPDEISITSEQAVARLAAIGFRDPKGALGHIRAMTAGVSRRAAIQRHLLPVMLQWFANGADPDYGLLAFRRLSDTLGETYWFLRMLRDSSGAASRLTQVLSGSRFAAELLERIPESAAWLENDHELRPRPFDVLRAETAATIARHDTPDAVAAALRTARRREVLRLACAAILGLVTVQELAKGLTDVTTVFLQGTLDAIRGSAALARGDGIEFAVIGMGRYGGREIGFGSDTDVLYVYRAVSVDGETAQSVARFIVNELVRLTEDHRLPLELDNDLRPEGKNGIVVRSLDSYRAYYERWSLTWEAQALLRARGVAGDVSLMRDFEAVANTVRYPTSIEEKAVREVKRIKARVEKERLPQGADPARHLKLGRGSLSDVEWYVQLLQLEHGAEHPSFRTTSTLDALEAEVQAGYVDEADAARLREAWIFASRARSAMTLWTNRTADVLPSDRQQLEGVARLLEYPPGSATALEEDYLAVTRRARAIFERDFYGAL